MISSQRHLFDIPESVAYFNSAYNSPMLKSTVEKLTEGAASKLHPWKRTQQSFFDDAERIRVLASALFGGCSDGYAVVPSASYGLSAAARIIETVVHAGNRIVMMAEEFPSVVLPFRRVAREAGAMICTVPAPVDGDWTSALLDKICDGVRVVAVSTCHWTNGARLDLPAISERCRELGAILVLDATQSLGVTPFSIDEVKPDFLVAAGYKWLLCPYGFGLFYASRRWWNSRPLEEVWLARENADDFKNLVKYNENYMAGARRFEMGEKGIPTILPGAIDALTQLLRWGVDEVSDTLSLINEEIKRHLRDLGFTMADDRFQSSHMFGAQLPSDYQGNLISRLAENQIFISQRGDALRFAPHVHVNENDIDRLLGMTSKLVRSKTLKQLTI